MRIELRKFTRNGHPERLLRLFRFSPEGGIRTAGVRKPPDLGAHPTPLNAQRATYEVSGEW